LDRPAGNSVVVGAGETGENPQGFPRFLAH
jgi:hypothetical protein